jgi:N-acetylglucosamine-6-phosphate deacetylase
VIVLAGGDLALPGRILQNASLVIDGARIVAVEPDARVDAAGATIVETPDCYIVPGFVDVHVHGVDGHDTLDEGDAVARIASRLPRYGVTAFCPTTVACAPSALRTVLAQVATARAMRPANSARVLPAHLESNFINPEYRGAQPAECLRLPSDLVIRRDGAFSTRDILDIIAGARADVGIVTLAPELPGGVELVRALVAEGTRVSLGHSGASLDEAMAAIDAGARHATHLFNRMAPMTHRAPGVAGAVLARDEVAAELICDGYHVHPAMSRIAIASKGVGRVMAITDGTAGSGLPVGSVARLGGQPIRVTEHAAVLDAGTLAGSTLTMDRAFRTIVATFGFSVTDAAMLCSTTPARELGLTGSGVLVEGGSADVVVLDRRFRVVRTFIDGREVYARSAAASS